MVRGKLGGGLLDLGQREPEGFLAPLSQGRGMSRGGGRRERCWLVILGRRLLMVGGGVWDFPHQAVLVKSSQDQTEAGVASSMTLLTSPEKTWLALAISIETIDPSLPTSMTIPLGNSMLFQYFPFFTSTFRMSSSLSYHISFIFIT